MTQFAMYNRFTAKPEKRAALVQQLLKAAGLMQDVAECRLYIVNESAEDDDDVWVTELWANAEDHAASLDLPGVRELVRETMPLLAGAPEQIRLRPAGGKL